MKGQGPRRLVSVASIVARLRNDSKYVLDNNRSVSIGLDKNVGE